MSLRAIACWAFDEAFCHLSLPIPRSTGTCVLRHPSLLHSCARSILPSFITTRTVHPSWYSSLRPGIPGFASIPVRHPPYPACIRRSSLWHCAHQNPSSPSRVLQRVLDGFKGGFRFPYGIKGVALQRRSKTTSSWHSHTESTSLRALFTVDS